MRHASIAMSCVADENATTSANAPNSTRPPPGPIIVIATRPAITPACASRIQLRRFPSRRSTGSSMRSRSGAQRNFNEYASPTHDRKPIAESSMPASRSHAPRVLAVSRNGRPAEKPSASIARTRGSRSETSTSRQPCVGLGAAAAARVDICACAFIQSGMILGVSAPTHEGAACRAARPGEGSRATLLTDTRCEESMKAYKKEFLELALELGVLQFGEFKLKSGRISPYFFNAGLFNSGYAAARVGRCYASAIAALDIEFDMLFGAAYKAIPLVALAAAALAEHHDLDYPFAYNRKEAKDHGEGGITVGAPIAGRVLILDDVITAGTAVREVLEIIRA